MKKLHILIAEDSKTQMKVLEKQLSTQYMLTGANNGSEAIKKLAMNPKPHVILLSLRMPIVDGFGVLKHIIAEKIKIKILVITSQLRQSVESQVIKLGADYLLTKPLDVETLYNLLERWTCQILGKEALKAELDTSGKKYPFSIIEKCGYICGYENVKFFHP